MGLARNDLAEEVSVKRTRLWFEHGPSVTSLTFIFSVGAGKFWDSGSIALRNCFLFSSWEHVMRAQSSLSMHTPTLWPLVEHKGFTRSQADAVA